MTIVVSIHPYVIAFVIKTYDFSGGILTKSGCEGGLGWVLVCVRAHTRPRADDDVRERER